MSENKTLQEFVQNKIQEIEARSGNVRDNHIKALAIKDAYNDFASDVANAESWRDISLGYKKIIEYEEAKEQANNIGASPEKHEGQKYAEYKAAAYSAFLVNQMAIAGQNDPSCSKIFGQITKSLKKLQHLQQEWHDAYKHRWLVGDNAVETVKAKEHVDDINKAIADEKQHLRSLTFDGIEAVEALGKEIPLREEIEGRWEAYDKERKQIQSEINPEVAQEAWKKTEWKLTPLGDTLESNQKSRYENNRILNEIKRAAQKEVDATRPDLDLSKDLAYKSLQSAKQYADIELANTKAYQEYLKNEIQKLKQEYRANKGFWNRAIHGDHRDEIRAEFHLVRAELKLAQARVAAAEKEQQRCNRKVASYKADRDIRYDKAVASIAPEQKIVAEKISQAKANIEAFKIAQKKEIGIARARVSELAGNARREIGQIKVHNDIEVNLPHKDGQEPEVVAHNGQKYQPLRESALNLDGVNTQEIAVTEKEARQLLEGAKAEREEIIEETWEELEKAGRFSKENDVADKSLQAELSEIDAKIKEAKVNCNDAARRELRAESKLQYSKEQDAVKRGFFGRLVYESKTRECSRELSLAKIDKTRASDNLKALEARKEEITKAIGENDVNRQERFEAAIYEHRPDLKDYDVIIREGERSVQRIHEQNKGNEQRIEATQYEQEQAPTKDTTESPNQKMDKTMEYRDPENDPVVKKMMGQAEIDRDNAQKQSQRHGYEPPQEVRDYNDSDAAWKVISDNAEKRREIYAEARKKVIQEIGKTEDDSKYIAFNKELNIASRELNVARDEEKAAAIERNGDGTKEHPGTEQELKRAQANLNKSIRADYQNSSFWKSLNYESQTMERTADRDEAKGRDNAAAERQAKAKEAREQAQKRYEKASEAFKQYKHERDTLIKKRAYEKEPILHEYDKALATDRARYSQGKTIARTVARTMEMEQSREGGRDMR